MLLEKDTIFMDKRKSVIQHMKEGNHMFYSSMQELLKYVSTQFLRSVQIDDNYLKEKRNKILVEGGNAISTIKLVCTLIKQPTLFESINMSLMNILANTSKHSTLVFPYAEHYGEDIVSIYNDYIESMWNAVGNDTIFSENCCIDFEYISSENDANITNNQQNIIKSNSYVDKYINGEISELAFSAVYDKLSDDEKLKYKVFLLDKIDKKYNDNDGFKQVVTMGGNEWFVYCKFYDKKEMNSSYGKFEINIALIEKNTKFKNIKVWYDCDNQEYVYSASVGKTITINLKTDYRYGYSDNHLTINGSIQAIDDEKYRQSKSNLISFRCSDEKLETIYIDKYKD